MREAFTFVVVGIAGGSTYALLALGLVLVHSVSRVLNFAQGAFGTLAVVGTGPQGKADAGVLQPQPQDETGSGGDGHDEHAGGRHDHTGHLDTGAGDRRGELAGASEPAGLDERDRRQDPDGPDERRQDPAVPAEQHHRRDRSRRGAHRHRGHDRHRPR